MSDPINAWLAAQRESIERWLAAPASGEAQQQLQEFWQSIAQGLSPAARELAQQLAQLGPGFASGTTDALSELFGASAGKTGESSFARWLDLAPVGYFREHQAQAQELTRALHEHQRIASQMAGAIAKIHADAIELLTKKVQALAQAGDAVADTRRLYNLWIECGEQVFAQHARGDLFSRLQGELANASMRLRIAQQTIAEAFLKSLDLPTRAELNSVHKRLKELRDRIEQLEAAAATPRRRARSKR